MKCHSSLLGSLFFMAFVILFFSSCSDTKRPGKPRVLVFSKTAGFHHVSISDGIAAIQKLGLENGFEVDTTVNASYFTEDSLKKYSAVVFLNTTGDVLNNYQEADFERYIQSGGGYVGIHAAADTEYDWGWYGRLAGAYFLDHPGINDPHPNVQDGVINVLDRSHASTSFLPEKWNRKDEWYSFRNLNKEVKVLMSIDEDSYKGGVKMGDHPVAWYHEYDGGRAFYTASGHTKESFTEELFLKHLLEGINYAIGDNKELDYSKAKTKRVPEEDRFSKTTLAIGDFYEPTEMTILPNLDILIAQRRGEIMLYKNGDTGVKQVAFLDVYHQSGVQGVNAEEGVLGIQADPDFAKNRWVYVFYSPSDTSVNRLSRFKFENDAFDLSSEQKILEFYSQRGICCHTGGSIAFDKDGLLYVSTGDNSTPFNEKGQKFVNNGYAPLDDRPGHEQYDARRSSGNANDLRGKILRIRVKEDGSYEIPEGNLYAAGTEGTRPEIYVQGNRNPYRISVDKKNGFLYWGEVGPDARADSMGVRGPIGYDEVNQARKAGNFGWPYFVGKNYAYNEFNYGTGESGEVFDPQKPVNRSRNNTGIKELPPAEPAFIWYPYTESREFPQVKTGGRNAMAGPVYYTDMYPKGSRLPDYYDGKLFIYDWVRGWIRVVTLQQNGDYDKMEPFMDNTRFNSLIDMEVGPDGQLYILEYGSGWFTKNPDAALSRIDFNAGNRAPKIEELIVDRTSGTLPLTVVATVKAKDPENDKMTYVWNLGNGVTKETKEPKLEHTFDKVGDYDISVEVFDSQKLSAKSNPVSVYAGNEEPIVNISITGNKTFYFPNKPVAYTVSVEDKDDPSAADDLSNLFVSADYLEGVDQAEASQGHKVMSDVMLGKNMTTSLDCKACHKEDEKSIGPSYTDVARRYRRNNNAVNVLATKIIKGGSGVWGDVNMPAHLDMKEAEAKQIVSYIMSLGGETKEQKSLPASGTIKPTLDKAQSENGMLILSATYTDKGGPNIKPLTGGGSVVLRNHKMGFANAKNIKEYTPMQFGGMHLMITPKGPASFSLDQIDLSDIVSAEVMAFSQQPLDYGFAFELRLGGPEGKKIGEAIVKQGMPQGEGRYLYMMKINIDPVNDGKLHDVYIVSHAIDDKEEAMLALASIQFNAK